MRKVLIELGDKRNTHLVVNNSKSLKLSLCIFTVQIAEWCTILLGVLLLQSQCSIFHSLSLFFLNSFQNLVKSQCFVEISQVHKSGTTQNAAECIACSFTYGHKHSTTYESSGGCERAPLCCYRTLKQK